jgi:hypothetical protein
MTAEEFWNWFLSEKTEIEKFIHSDTDDYSIYNELTDKLRSYHNLVMPELTRDKEDFYVLILTCDGKKDGIEPVEQLFNSAPGIDKWKIQKFRAPGHVVELNYQGLSLKPESLKIKYVSNGLYFDIVVFIKGYSDTDERFKGLAFLYLDHFVGEYNVMTRIGQIKFKELALPTQTSDKVSLQEFRSIIERLN